MRQQGHSQKRFREILKSVSTGTFNENHWNDLEKRYIPFSLIPIEGAMENWIISFFSRAWQNLTKEEQDRFNKHAVKLGSTNPSNTLFNIKKLLELDTPKALISAINEPPKTAGKASYSRAGGLHNNILLAEGAKVGRPIDFHFLQRQQILVTLSK